jgi:hypothetical protein
MNSTKQHAPKMEWLRVTPQMAEEWLKLNTENRPVKSSQVAYLQSEITAGRFIGTGSPIIFVGKTLVDGQHRLMAIVRADKPVEMMVVHHPVNAQTRQIFNVIDTGVTRSFSDLLALKGEKNATQLSSILRLLEIYHSAKDLSDGQFIPYTFLSPRLVIDRIASEKQQGCKKISRHQELSWLDKYSNARESAAFSKRYPSYKFITPTSLGALHYILTEVDELFAQNFLATLMEGGAPRDSPLHIIRETLIRQYTNSTSDQKSIAFAYIALLVFSTWNAIRMDKALKRADIDAGKPVPLPR